MAPPSPSPLRSSGSGRACSCRKWRRPPRSRRSRPMAPKPLSAAPSYAEAQQRCDAYVAETGALVDPSLRCGRDDRGPGHGGAGMGGGPRATRAREARHGPGRGWRRRAHLRRRRLVSRAGSRSSASSQKVRARFTRRSRRTSRSTCPSSRSPPICSAQSGSANSISTSPGKFVSDVVLVEDMAIAEAQRRLWADLSVIAEPGGAAAFAAIASGAYRPERGERVGVLVCGANADLKAFARNRARPRRAFVTPLGQNRPARHCDGGEPELLSGPLSARPNQPCGALGRSQAVRQRILIPPSGGSNPPAPAKDHELVSRRRSPAALAAHQAENFRSTVFRKRVRRASVV